MGATPHRNLLSADYVGGGNIIRQYFSTANSDLNVQYVLSLLRPLPDILVTLLIDTRQSAIYLSIEHLNNLFDYHFLWNWFTDISVVIYITGGKFILYMKKKQFLQDGLDLSLAHTAMRLLILVGRVLQRRIHIATAVFHWQTIGGCHAISPTRA